MMYYYFDTSGLVKLYISETGSQWALGILKNSKRSSNPACRIAFSKISIVELASALTRLERQHTISQQQRLFLYNRFLDDTENCFRLLNLTDETIKLAASMAQKLALRGYDAVHLASAQMLNNVLISYRAPAITFVSADKQLCQAAILEGFATINPNNLAEN